MQGQDIACHLSPNTFKYVCSLHIRAFIPESCFTYEPERTCTCTAWANLVWRRSFAIQHRTCMDMFASRITAHSLPLKGNPKGPCTQYLGTLDLGHSNFSTGFGQVYDYWVLGPLGEVKQLKKTQKLQSSSELKKSCFKYSLLLVQLMEMDRPDP